MAEYRLDDRLLSELRDARPFVGSDDFRSDSSEAAELLGKILSMDDSSDVLGTDGAHNRTTTSLSTETSPVERRAHGVRVRSRRFSLLWISIVAGAIMISAVAIPLTISRTPRPPVTLVSAWRLTGSISQPAWALQPTIGSDPDRLSCPSTTTCYATGLTAPEPNGIQSTPLQAVVEVTHDGGVTWQQSLLPTAGTLVSSMTCPAVDTCMLLGGASGAASNSQTMFTTTDGGQSWTALPLPGGTGDAALLLSCATPLNCDSLQNVPGPAGLGGVRYISNVTTDGGHTWSASAMPGTFRGYALECSTPDLCIAAGSEPTSYRITDPTTQGDPAAVLYSSDGGVTWARGSVPAGGDVIGSMSCADPSHCVAVDITLGTARTSGVLISANGGQTWSASPSRNLAQLNLESISCPSDSDCWVSGSTLPAGGGGATDQQGVILSTHDGGQTWTSEQVPTDQGVPLGVIGGLSCSAVADCLALANRPSSSSMLGQQVVLANGSGSAAMGPATSQSSTIAG
jgi:photosystem II stability/assembly factor-like uncharacterized protein